jgi:hypothetical protein
MTLQVEAGRKWCCPEASMGPDHTSLARRRRSSANYRISSRCRSPFGPAVDLLNGTALLLNTRIIRIEGTYFGTNGTEDLEDVVGSLDEIEVDGAAGDADLFFCQLAEIAHELEDTNVLVSPDVAPKSGHGLFVGVQKDEVPVFESCLHVRQETSTFSRERLFFNLPELLVQYMATGSPPSANASERYVYSVVQRFMAWILLARPLISHSACIETVLREAVPMSSHPLENLICGFIMPFESTSMI